MGKTVKMSEEELVDLLCVITKCKLFGKVDQDLYGDLEEQQDMIKKKLGLSASYDAWNIILPSKGEE